MLGWNTFVLGMDQSGCNLQCVVVLRLRCALLCQTHHDEFLRGGRKHVCMGKWGACALRRWRGAAFRTETEGASKVQPWAFVMEAIERSSHPMFGRLRLALRAYWVRMDAGRVVRSRLEPPASPPAPITS